MGELCIPVEALDQHTVVLGKTGAGKSSALRHIVEHLLRENKRVVIIDPKGDWWGLKSSADGKGAGFPIITFGDFKEEDATDVPINMQSGKHVAELVSTGNRPAIVGFRGWMTSHMVKFWIDFASTLFRENVGELYLVVDEVHNFAPKGQIKGLEGNMGSCLHWTNRLMSEGRGLGIVALIASQRPQKVHNDTLTSCETLVAMRVVHAADRGAVEDWIKGCGDPKIGKAVLDGLALLARGSAYVWSPEIKFGPELIAFPLFETFDSFAPPQLQKKVRRKGWASIDLDAVREKMAAVIEEQAANDPRELKKQLAQAREMVVSQQLALEKRPTETKIKEVPILSPADFKRLEKMQVGLENELMLLRQKLGTVPSQTVQIIPTATDRFLSGTRRETSPKPPPAPLPPKPDAGKAHPIEGGLNSAEQRILNALGWWWRARNTEPTRTMVAFAAGFKVGGYFKNMLGALSTKGLITYPKSGLVALTGTGQAMVDPSEEVPTRGNLLRNVLEILSKPQAKMFEALINADGSITREELANRAGFQIGGYFKNMLGSMRTAGLIEYPEAGMVRLASLFEAL